MGISVKDLLAKGAIPKKGFGTRGDSRAQHVVEFLSKNKTEGYSLADISKAIAYTGSQKSMQGTIHGLKKAGKVDARQIDGKTYWFTKQV